MTYDWIPFGTHLFNWISVGDGIRLCRLNESLPHFAYARHSRMLSRTLKPNLEATIAKGASLQGWRMFMPACALNVRSAQPIRAEEDEWRKLMRRKSPSTCLSKAVHLTLPQAPPSDETLDIATPRGECTLHHLVDCLQLRFPRLWWQPGWVIHVSEIRAWRIGNGIIRCSVLHMPPYCHLSESWRCLALLDFKSEILPAAATLGGLPTC